MSAQVVCISRTLGAGGETIGRAVAARLRFLYVDEEVITTAGEKARIDPMLIAAAEHRQSLVSRLMDALAVVPQAKSRSAGRIEDGVAASRASTREGYRALIREAVAEIATHGNAVIVAHAASLMLAGSPGVVRVLVTASDAQRAARLALADQSLDARRAAEAIAASDRERREYLREFYSVREELPTHYDLVLNTDVLAPEQAVAVIVKLAQGWAPA